MRFSFFSETVLTFRSTLGAMAAQASWSIVLNSSRKLRFLYFAHSRSVERVSESESV